MPQDDSSCPKCGAPLFRAIPGETTRRAIRRFASAHPAFSKNPDALDGWVHPGEYCTSCSHAVWVEYAQPALPTPAHSYKLFLKDVGSDWRRLALALKHVYNLSHADAIRRARELKPSALLAEGPLWQLVALRDKLTEAGAMVYIHDVPDDLTQEALIRRELSGYYD